MCTCDLQLIPNQRDKQSLHQSIANKNIKSVKHRKKYCKNE